MNWTDSMGFQSAEVPTGFVHRRGSMTPKDFVFVNTPSRTPQQVLMIEAFADLALTGDDEKRTAPFAATKTTQRYLDAVWAKFVEG